MSRERECSAPKHKDSCPCPKCGRTDCGDCKKTNRDHHTPKCIIKEFDRVTDYSWASAQKNNIKNLQPLSYECHKDKDSDTPARRDLLKRMHNGEYISLDEYKRTIHRKFSD